jgi:cyclopropane fatty-acyl-phospholipid synthase-like methyltransferase
MPEYEPAIGTPRDLIRHKLALTELRTGELLVDLGCGDGRVLFEAAASFGARCRGYEVRGELVAEIRREACRRGLSERVTVCQQDFMTADVLDADVVALYLTAESLARLAPKLRAELPVGARVVTHTFRIPGWPVEREDLFDCGARRMDELFLYRQP